MNNYQQVESRMTHLKQTQARIIQKTNYAFVTPALTEVCELALALAQRMDDARAELALFTGAADSYEHLERACALLEPEE